MSPHEFEIGKIFKRSRGDIYTWARINDNSMISLSTNNGFPMGNIESVNGNWANDYNEITFEDLEPRCQVVYLEHFPKQKEPEGCTCDIDVIMQQGCQCGWMQKERA